MLAKVPKQGLDAVLVAVELALESAPPSGRVSCEHVYSTVNLVNALEQEKAQGKAGRIAASLQRMNLVIRACPNFCV